MTLPDRLTLDISDFEKALHTSWSLASSSKWTPDNPAAGQCGVTALVAHDLMGVDILKTQLDDGSWHFYNGINGARHDFTDSQFTKPLTYQDLPSNRDEAFGDTNAQQYEYLGTSVRQALGV